MDDQLDDPHVVILRRDALAEGYDDRHIRDLVRSGVWQRIRRGAYCSKQLWDASDDVMRHRLLARAVLRAAHPCAVLTHASAVVEHGAPTWEVDLSEVHITRSDGKAGRREAGVVHHCGGLARDEVTVVHGVRVSNPARSVVELSTVTGLESCLVTANWLLGRGLTTRSALEAYVEQCRFWPGSLSNNLLTHLLDGRNMWPGETRTSHLIWREHLPSAVPQFEVRDDDGVLIGIVDFAWPEYGVFLEFDGRIKYERLRREGETLEEVILREKRREELICARTGWVCIRITWEDLARPVTTARRIRALLDTRRPTVG